MAKIAEVTVSTGLSGFYFDDQLAIKKGARTDGFFYVGEPATKGFRSVRMAGESASVMLQLDDGQIAIGDCAAIQYSGAGGRCGVFLAEDYSRYIRERIGPLLAGREPASFREMAAEIESLEDCGAPIHPAVRYGVSQAILDAVAKSTRRLPCEVVAEEWGLPLEAAPVRVFAQSGDDRYSNVDKMIIKRVDVMPHALINNIPDKLGERGEKLLAYVKWLRDRIIEKRDSPDYAPELHIDVYGTVGILFSNDTARMAAYLAELGEAARPFKLRIEGPMDAGSRDAQIGALVNLRGHLKAARTDVGIVADEWCNSIEDIRLFADRGAVDMVQIKTPVLGGIQNSADAVLYCRERGIGAYLGGTCNETDGSARLCVHVALATRPDQMLAKPGMGADEGLMVVTNEMRRTLALLESRKAGKAGNA